MPLMKKINELLFYLLNLLLHILTQFQHLRARLLLLLILPFLIHQKKGAGNLMIKNILIVVDVLKKSKVHRVLFICKQVFIFHVSFHNNTLFLISKQEFSQNNHPKRHKNHTSYELINDDRLFSYDLLVVTMIFLELKESEEM
ncbi:hypothetical protein BDA99DRAFT_544614 [Phascolomyces articulosus]|uniref:Uncharacterized protein n=1 Tax=Phascolomyces articulosus TaxID=60185 RepID=A0AAD5JJX1_9FUNG|nr:hypothetical protein BDA99DRAFT_544614 [Phascolomyces articulosus]